MHGFGLPELSGWSYVRCRRGFCPADLLYEVVDNFIDSHKKKVSRMKLRPAIGISPHMIVSISLH